MAACTITATPATGAQDWTDFIIQQGLTDRGFSRVSLTNFATTAASLVGTGSIFELAGSIYSTNGAVAISLATGTASASIAVYILAIPAAGGTTCTFQLDSTAPTWIDAKQGFYASAASTTRYLGGAYLVSAASIVSKFIYTQEMLTAYLLPTGNTRPLLKKKFQIGEWNMDDTAAITIAHGLPVLDKIILGQVTIINDVGSVVYPISYYSGLAGDIDINIIIGPIFFQVERLAGGFFDNAAFNATASTLANRGWIYMEYEA